MQVWSKDQENPLQESMATHSSILAWRLPQTEDRGVLQSIGLQRVGHDWSDLAHTHSCKLLHIEQMHNKILPFSTGNNIQYPVISHTGYKYKKNVYICITKAYTSFMIKKIKNKSTYKLIFLKIRLFYLLSPAPFWQVRSSPVSQLEKRFLCLPSHHLHLRN